MSIIYQSNINVRPVF